MLILFDLSLMVAVLGTMLIATIRDFELRDHGSFLQARFVGRYCSRVLWREQSPELPS